MKINDHGPIHVKIVANSALQILRLLTEQGIVPNCVSDYQMQNDDAELIVVLGAILHDVGHVIHRSKHEQTGVWVAKDAIKRLLDGIYADSVEKQIIMHEVSHIILSHEPNIIPFTLEAGVVKVADALDMEKGRGRMPYDAGSVSIHSVSVLAVDEVIIKKGNPNERPLRIAIKMTDSAGIFQVDDLLKEKIETSGIKDLITVDAIMLKDGREDLIKEFQL
jgi:metal-dependent HD superfamily phosphatase/phosphodiesterase